jgi:murein hydrolase activator
VHLRFLVFILMVLVGFQVETQVNAAPTANQIAAERVRLKQLEENRAASRAAAEKLEREAAKLRAEVDQSTSRMVNVAAEIQKRESKLGGVEKRLAKLKTRREAQLTVLNSRSGEVVKLLAALQNLTRQPPQLLLVKPDAAINTARSAAMLKLVVPELQNQTGALRREITAMNEIKAELDSEKTGYQLQLAGLQQDRVTLDKLRAEREVKRAQLLVQADSETEKALALAREANDVKDLIGRLETQERRRTRLASLSGPRLRPNFAAPVVIARVSPPTSVAQATPPAGKRVSTPVGSAVPRTQIASLPSVASGNLPVRGEIVTGFGQTGATGASRGLSIRTRSGAAVTAPAAGRVVFAGPFRAYGQMLIISHGAGYHTLIAGLTRLDAQNQQMVQPGEPLGVMGSDSDAAMTLYFELRRGGEAINPASWLALAKRG